MVQRNEEDRRPLGLRDPRGDESILHPASPDFDRIENMT